ncbi:MAG: HAD family hydrolase [Planctomycetaceae bacterium]|nr:HAD family hydrolase [Planctomycetaceae bacterium]
MHAPQPLPLLILDLDETLIHAVAAPLRRPHDFQVGPWFVYKRPGVDQFLTRMATDFQLAVWSSATPDYVDAIVARLFGAEPALQFQWSRDRCTDRYDPEYQCRYLVKDLNKTKRAGFPLERTLMVDDTPSKLERNFGNAVYVLPFTGDPNDTELRQLGPFLLSLADCRNVRVVEKRGWRSRQTADIAEER